MSTSVRLSICIPTHNFGAFIGETLTSIVGQATDDVEIVIVDGASTDDTPHIVAAFQRMFPRIRYERLDRKGGIDRDMALAVEHASGDYCWFFGADDLMNDGAIAAILSRLAGGDDVYLAETTLCTFDMQPRQRLQNLRSDVEETFELSDGAQRRRYFALAANTQAFFSFCGAIIFRRDRWNASVWDESFVGSCWAHAVRLLSLIPHGLRVRPIPRPLTRKRLDNDSFLSEGLANRVRIGIEGYLRIASALFGERSEEAAAIRRCLKAEYTLRYMSGVRVACEEQRLPEQVAQLTRDFRLLYGRSAWTLLYEHTPSIVWRVVGRLHRLLTRPRAVRKSAS